MAGIKIHQYPLERFTFGDDDYYDIDYWDGAAYQTAKIKGSVLKAALSANLFTDDLTLSASRNQDLNSQQFKMRNGALQFGEVGAGLISSFLVESSNFDVRTADPLGDHTGLNIGGSGGTIQNISAGGSDIGKIQITGPSLSGVFTSGGVGPVVSANPSLYSVVNEDPGTGDKTTILQTHTDITQLSEDATRSTRIYQTKDTLQIANFLSVGGGDQITLRWDNTLNNLVIEDDRTTKTGIEYYADYSGSFTARSLVDKGYVDANAGASELNDLTDVNTGLPVSPTTADDGKLLFYDHAVNEFITDDAVTHGTVIINGKKSTAGTIAKGTPVYLVGFDADLHTVEVADATSSATMPIIGLAAESMDNTNSKHITTFGKLTGVDTTVTSALNPNGETWAVNDALYMSTTAGGFTKVRPTGGATEIQRIAKVLKVDATGGQLFVFNTARTAGLPNLSTDKLWIGDANGIPQEVDKSTIGGASIYTQDDTIGSGRVATLTDSLTFKGADNLSTSSNIKVQGFAGTDLWDFRNNGDVYLNQSSSVYMATNKTLKVDGSSNTNQNLFELNGATNAFGTGAITVGAYGNVEVKGVNSAGNFKVLTMLGNEYFTLDGNGNNSILRTKAFDIGTSTTTGYKMSFDAGRHQFIRLGIVGAYFDLVNNSVQFWEAGMTSRKFIIGNSSLVGTEEISFQGRTAVKGANTLSTSTAFEIYDGDTTPSKLWDFRNNGDVYLNTNSDLNIGSNLYSISTTATSEYDAITVNTYNGSYVKYKNRGGIVIKTQGSNSAIITRNTADTLDVFKVNNSGGGDFDCVNSDVRIGNFTNNDYVNIDNNGLGGIIGGVEHHKIGLLNTNAATTFFNLGFSANSFFAIGSTVPVGTEKISLQANTLIDGTLDMNNNRITKTIVNPTVQETTSTATLTINANQENTGVLTAQAVALTVANPTGTAVQGQKLVYRIKDNGTGRAITWGANFRAIGVTLPTTTTASKLLYVGCIYNTTDSKWDVVAVNEEA